VVGAQSLESARSDERTITASASPPIRARQACIAALLRRRPWGRLLDAAAERLGDRPRPGFSRRRVIATARPPAVLAYSSSVSRAGCDGHPTLLISTRVAAPTIRPSGRNSGGLKTAPQEGTRAFGVRHPSRRWRALWRVSAGSYLGAYANISPIVASHGSFGRRRSSSPS